jgi:ribonuclease J
MYGWIRPRILIPVHGEARHMAEQARFAIAQGVPSAIYQKNGDLVRLAPNGPEKIGEERTGRLVLDGDVILPADGSTVNERRRISVHGLIAVVVPVDDKGCLAGELVIRPFGVPIEQDRDDFIADATDAGRRAVSEGVDEDKLKEAVRLAVRRCATLWTGKKPIVEVMLAKVGA